MAKKGDRAARPAAKGNWTLKFLDNKAAKDWEQLSNQMPEAAIRAYDRFSEAPRDRDARHHPLKGDLSHATVGKELCERWQNEITSGGRVWALLQESKKIVWIEEIHFGAPKVTHR